MAKQAKKTAKAPFPINSILAPAKKVKVAETINEVKETQEKAINMGLKKAENLVYSANEAAAEVVDIGSNNIQAWNEFGSTAANILRNISSEMMESYQRSFSNCVEISQEVFGCRTASDMADLQSKILQRTLEGSFNKSARLSKTLFEGWAKALEPLNECAAISTDRVRKRLAA